MIRSLAVGLLAVSSCYSRGTDHTLDELPVAHGEAPTYRYQDEIHWAYGESGMISQASQWGGKPARVPCATCHEGRTPTAGSAEATVAGPPHESIALEHGGQHCQGCHVPPSYEQFKRQSGAPLPYSQVIELCAQCHGRQKDDFDHGAHGGMTGYWDRDRGPRQRNHCLDCHNPHRPALVQVEPAPLPNYRFVKDGRLP